MTSLSNLTWTRLVGSISYVGTHGTGSSSRPGYRREGQPSPYWVFVLWREGFSSNNFKPREISKARCVISAGSDFSSRLSSSSRGAGKCTGKCRYRQRLPRRGLRSREVCAQSKKKG